jgi:hypothetical protein
MCILEVMHQHMDNKTKYLVQGVVLIIRLLHVISDHGLQYMPMWLNIVKENAHCCSCEEL